MNGCFWWMNVLNECMYEWRNKWTNKSMDAWMNEWMSERIWKRDGLRGTRNEEGHWNHLFCVVLTFAWQTYWPTNQPTEQPMDTHKNSCQLNKCTKNKKLLLKDIYFKNRSLSICFCLILINKQTNKPNVDTWAKTLKGFQ